MNEYQAITGCQTGDPKAQKFIFDKYSKGMLLVCLRYVKKREDAEEMMLNGFYKFFKQIDNFKYNGDGSIGAWLKKIVINECLMLLRRKDFQITEEVNAEEASIDEEAITRLSTNEIFELIRTLPVGCRTVFNMFVIEGMTHKEIALALEISEGASKSQLNKARFYLQKGLKKKMSYEK